MNEDAIYANRSQEPIKITLQGDDGSAATFSLNPGEKLVLLSGPLSMADMPDIPAAFGVFPLEASA
jgi:hypothetical protein